MKKALICGASGQDGAYLAKLLLEKGYEVHGTSRDAQVCPFSNLKTLGLFDKVEVCSMVSTDFRSVLQVLSKIKPDEIYNLAGQSSVGFSFKQPFETMESISLGTLNILEVIRFMGLPVRFYNAGSSECFGDTGGKAATEQDAFRPRSPYAVAKSAAHWEVANYREAYGIFACTGILFNHESPLRPRRFVTRKIISSACEIAQGEKKILELGNIEIRRDWGWAPEYVDAMWRMLQVDDAEDFVISTGESNSLQDFCAIAFEAFGLNWRDHVKINKSFFRPSEIMYGGGDATNAEKKLGWKAKVKMRDVVMRMVEDEKARR
ncbi:MAG TPA: GDP-mannose 4,6-dehydratase [Gammaproteobacteria bacterium]|nr:GDP-mannose 4,6-dehydratase [Gammaproteobacteria bacterium]